jgi:two-component system chemotaxis response regulator CheB
MADHPETLPVGVVIAPSAGGLRALRTILAGLLKSFPAAVVVVQHRSIGSMLTSLLEKKSVLPVSDAVEGQTIEAGRVYVNRPDRHLTINDEHRFEYRDGQKIRHVLSSANPLFESSADVFGHGTIGVMLTGSDHDGTDGVQAIKSGGGIVIAQDKATSEHFHMPASAISTGSVDYVLPLDDIAPALVRLVRHEVQ